MKRKFDQIARHVRVWQLIASLGCLASTSCTTYSEDTIHQVALPDFESFRVVGPVLEMHCGSVDCHGTQRRNYRIYSWSGSRLEPATEAPEAAPDPLPPGTIEPPESSPGFGQTTEEELWHNYTSTVLLEPEATSVVLREGLGVEELLLVSKGRGREHHKGEVAMEPGGPIDRCVISWLLGTLDQSACNESFELGIIPPDFVE